MKYFLLKLNAALLVSLIIAGPAWAITVDCETAGIGDYDTILDVLAAAVDGDTISITGECAELNTVRINGFDRLTLEGDGATATISRPVVAWTAAIRRRRCCESTIRPTSFCDGSRSAEASGSVLTAAPYVRIQTSRLRTAAGTDSAFPEEAWSLSATRDRTLRTSSRTIAGGAQAPASAPPFPLGVPRRFSPIGMEYTPGREAWSVFHRVRTRRTRPMRC